MRIHPGLTLLAALAISAVCESVVPVTVELPVVVRVVATAVIFLLATAGLFWAVLLFRRFGTPTEPHEKPLSIVTSGPFRYSRNPMYVANVLFVVGFFFMVGSVWFLLTASLQFLLLNFLVIPAEEARLQQEFPDSAKAWFSRTRRWI